MTSFGPQQIISTDANNAFSVATADIDGDGDLDVLSASRNDNKIAWYKNDGSGNFGPQLIITTDAAGAYSVTTADVDGDGDLDVLSASRSDNKIAWYRNDGSGNFGPQQVITTAAAAARSVTTADIDKDGDLDVLSASRSDNKIAWYRNDGSGNFGPQVLITADTNTNGAYAVTTADVDGDGDLDVLSGSVPFSAGVEKIAWYKNDGSGNFGPQQVISTATYGLVTIITADIDGDGAPDVLSTSVFDNKIAWYKNDGSGNFGPQLIITTAAGAPRSITTADIDKDGDLDVLSASVFDNKIAWYENNGSGSFGPQQIISTAASFGTGVTTGDVDGDGDLDVLSASLSDNKIAWYENFSAPSDLALSNSSVAEASPVGTVVGSFSTTDPDTASGFTYTLVSGTGDSGNTAFTIDGDQLKLAVSPDFETQNSYSIRVRTTDPDGSSREEVFNISISDVVENTTPTDLTLSPTTVNENVAANTTVGSFSTTDAEGGSFTYELISGTGDSDNAAFTINGNQLKINASPDFEAKSSYSIRVKTTDAGGLSYAEALTIGVNNLNEAPTATGETVSTSKNAAVTVELGDNVTDPDLNGLNGALLSVTSTANGSTSIDQDARLISFTPTTGFSGTASFKYIITDAGGLPSNEATVTVEVGDILTTGNKSQDIQGNAGNDYISAGNGKDRIQGFGGNDTLLGNNGADTLDGGLGADILTGGNGPDTFVVNSLSESPLSGFDRITDFAIGTDLLDGITAVSAANLAELGTAASLTESGIAAVLTTGSFAANRAVTFSFGSRTFLAINDSAAGFSAATDALIEITGFSGSLTNLAIV